MKVMLFKTNLQISFNSSFFFEEIFILVKFVFSVFQQYCTIMYPGLQTLFKDPEADPGFFLGRLKLRLLCVHIYTCGKKKRNLKIPGGGGSRSL